MNPLIPLKIWVLVGLLFTPDGAQGWIRVDTMFTELNACRAAIPGWQPNIPSGSLVISGCVSFTRPRGI